MAILDTDDYVAVRAAIDLSLQAAHLPDAVIGLSIYQGVAEMEITTRDPDATTYADGSPEAIHIKNAAIFLTASLLVPAIPAIASEWLGESYRYQRQPVDWVKRAQELRTRAEGELAQAQTPGSQVATMPVLFTVAPGGRGR